MIPVALWMMLLASEPMTLVVGRGAVVDCPGGVARVSTSNPEAVDTVLASESEVLLQAKAAGQATLVVWSKAGGRTSYEVTVQPDLEPLRALLRESFPGEQIDVRPSRDSAALVGRASTPAVAERALALAAGTMKGAVSAVRVTPAPERQVLLRVRFAEVNRTVTTEQGVNLFSTGAANTPGAISTGQFPSVTTREAAGFASTFALSDILNVFALRPDLNLGVIIRDLQSRGLLQILAEPNLVATNGKEASFLAGGEFPVPIVQSGVNAGAVTVQFREFGIRLSFLPQLSPGGTIKLHVKPEVSTVDTSNGVTVSGFRIPALSTRRIETDVELAEGQSFVIAGLLDDRVIESLSELPGLSRIPVLGALFRSRARTKSKSELVVVVTPEVASPVASRPEGPRMPEAFLPAIKEDQ
jgi:pilus assembly protein CpaC